MVVPLFRQAWEKFIHGIASQRVKGLKLFGFAGELEPMNAQDVIDPADSKILSAEDVLALNVGEHCGFRFYGLDHLDLLSYLVRHLPRLPDCNAQCHVALCRGFYFG